MAQASVQISGSGGISSDSKSGLSNSSRMQRFLDIYRDSDSVSLHPEASKVSGSTVVDLVRWFADATQYSGTIFGYGDEGHIYEIDEDTITDLKTVSDSNGNGLGVLDNMLLYASKDTLGVYRYLSETPAFEDDFLSNGIDDLDQENNDSGQTYSLPTSINEGTSHRKTFTPTKDPLKTIQVLVASKGTGNWTLTVHDSDNNVIATDTIANGDITDATDLDFDVLETRVIIGKEYHFHLTSTQNDGTVTTGTSTDLEDVDYHTYFGILINYENHPMIQHTDGTRGMLVIANLDYIATYNGITYQPNKIQIEPGFEIQGFFKEGEYVVAYASRMSAEEGRFYYWDGIQPYYNFAKPITSGFINAVTNYKDRAFSITGETGEMNMSTAQTPFVKIQDIPQITRGGEVEIRPGAICVWQDRVHFGVGSPSTPGAELGIYEYGNRSDRATSNESVSTECLNYAYKISTGETRTSISIGALFPRAGSMLVGWQDDSGESAEYGIDEIAISNDPSPTGGWESLILDVGQDGKTLKSMPHREKTAQDLIISFETLPTGCTVTPKYKINRGSWVTGTAAIAGSTEARLPINLRYKEIQVGYDLVATTEYPTITGVCFIYDPLGGELPQ